MTDKASELLSSSALTVATNLCNSQRCVVIQGQLWDPAEKCKGAVLTIEERFFRLRKIRIHERGVRVRQAHAKDMEFAVHTADNTDDFAKIDLDMAWM